MVFALIFLTLEYIKANNINNSPAKAFLVATIIIQRVDNIIEVIKNGILLNFKLYNRHDINTKHNDTIGNVLPRILPPRSPPPDEFIWNKKPNKTYIKKKRFRFFKSSFGRIRDSYIATYIDSHGMIRYMKINDQVDISPLGLYPARNQLIIVYKIHKNQIQTIGSLKTSINFL
jgi:hypothetical protein